MDGDRRLRIPPYLLLALFDGVPRAGGERGGTGRQTERARRDDAEAVKSRHRHRRRHRHEKYSTRRNFSPFKFSRIN
ncbi:unnamed protein product [Lampetra planeri]